MPRQNKTQAILSAPTQRKKPLMGRAARALKAAPTVHRTKATTKGRLGKHTGAGVHTGPGGVPKASVKAAAPQVLAELPQMRRVRRGGKDQDFASSKDRANYAFNQKILREQRHRKATQKTARRAGAGDLVHRRTTAADMQHMGYGQAEKKLGGGRSSSARRMMERAQGRTVFGRGTGQGWQDRSVSAWGGTGGVKSPKRSGIRTGGIKMAPIKKIG